MPLHLRLPFFLSLQALPTTRKASTAFCYSVQQLPLVQHSALLCIDIVIIIEIDRVHPRQIRSGSSRQALGIVTSWSRFPSNHAYDCPSDCPSASRLALTHCSSCLSSQQSSELAASSSLLPTSSGASCKGEFESSSKRPCAGDRGIIQAFRGAKQAGHLDCSLLPGLVCQGSCARTRAQTLRLNN